MNEQAKKSFLNSHTTSCLGFMGSPFLKSASCFWANSFFIPPPPPLCKTGTLWRVLAKCGAPSHLDKPFFEKSKGAQIDLAIFLGKDEGTQIDWAIFLGNLKDPRTRNGKELHLFTMFIRDAHCLYSLAIFRLYLLVELHGNTHWL